MAGFYDFFGHLIAEHEWDRFDAFMSTLDIELADLDNAIGDVLVGWVAGERRERRRLESPRVALRRRELRPRLGSSRSRGARCRSRNRASRTPRHLGSLGLDVLLDVAYAVLTEGMTFEERAEFDRLLRERTGSGDTDAEAAKRRAYALAYGE